MIFLGDIAVPDHISSTLVAKILDENKEIFRKKLIICNLEGLIHDAPSFNDNKPVLYNDPSLLEILANERQSVMCLANNHILDFPDMFKYTIEEIQKKNLLYCGAGETFKNAESPLIFKEGNRSFALFNACWDFLLYNHSNPESGIHVARIRENMLLESIHQLKKVSPEISIITYFHWNLDMETIPFPMYRKFSKALIDSGTDLVIGAHSHCVQGGEKYGKGYIIYGLGNFFIPDYRYAGGNLYFPARSKISLGLEWDTDSDKVICHWFEDQSASESGKLSYLGSDDFEISIRLEEFSPFRGMSDDEYISYFKKNRRKKWLIPDYKDHRHLFRNRIYTSVLMGRAKFARLLARLKLIKWQN